MRNPDGKVTFSSYVTEKDFSEDELKVWKEALFRSKGATDNVISAYLIFTGASVDDVVKYGTQVTGGRVITRGVHSKLGADGRKFKQVLDAVPNFWDTTRGKLLLKSDKEILEKVGLDTTKKLPITKIYLKSAEEYVRRACKAIGRSSYHPIVEEDLFVNSRTCRAILSVDLFQPIMNINFAGGSERAIKALVDTTAMREDEFEIPKYEAMRKYEIDSLAHLDPSVAENISLQKLFCDILRDGLSYQFRHYPNSAKTIQTECELEAFFEVCKEMGIVGAMDGNIDGRYWCSAATASGIVKNVIRMGGTYRRLIKNGFVESVARQTVLGEINTAISRRATRPAVRFYARADYKDSDPEELASKFGKSKVKVKSGKSGKSGRKVMTLEEFVKAWQDKEEEQNE